MLEKDDINKCPSIFHDTFLNPFLIERFLLIIYTIIFFIGLVGNIMTIIIIKYNTHLRTPTNFYLLNLAVSDLMMLMCNLPLEMIEIHYREWPLSIIFCKLRNISAEFFTCSSILTILAFTCERYFAIVHPIHFHRLGHFRRAQNIIFIIWFISLIFSVPLGLSYEIDSYTTTLIFKTDKNLLNETISSINISCKSCVPKKSLAKLLSIIMIITSCCFFYFPMIIIGTIYLFIGKALRHVNKYENPSDHIELSLSSLSSFNYIGKKQINSSHSSIIDIKQQTKHIGSCSWLKTRARCQARKVVVKTLVAVVIAFFVCYAPLYLQRLLSAIMGLNSNLNSDSLLFSKIMAYLYIISGTTFYFGSVINPILYNVVSNKYRRAFRDLFCCRLTYNTKINIKNSKRKFIQTNRLNNQPIHYFVKKIPLQQQNTINIKLYSNQQQCKNEEKKEVLQMIKRPVLTNNQSTKSNVSSINSDNRERHPIQSFNSNASLPKECQIGENNKIMSWYHTTVLTTDRRPSRLIASCKRFSRRLSTGIFRAVRRIQIPDTRLDTILSKNHQHPRSLEEIMKCTRFTKSEIRLLYRSFKQECPGGNVSEERFREIYLQFFPQGSPIKYTHYLFSIIDRNHKGTFTFDDYILTLSVLCRGTLEEKLRWIFRLYDVNGEGQLTRENVSEIILSFYDLLGPSVQPRVDEHEIQQHVDEIFARIDPMQTEQITLEDFIDYCKRRPHLIESIQALSCCL